MTTPPHGTDPYRGENPDEHIVQEKVVVDPATGERYVEQVVEEPAQRSNDSWAKWLAGALALLLLVFGALAWFLTRDNSTTDPLPPTTTATSETTQPEQPQTQTSVVESTRVVEKTEAPAPAPAPAEAPAETGNDANQENEDALAAAEELVGANPLSEEWLRDELINTRGFSEEAATYAVDHVGADFDANAVQFARNAIDEGVGEDEVEQTLLDAGFTPDQAEHAISQL